MSGSKLHARLAELYRELAEVHGRLAQEDADGYWDQSDSPLGPRLHCRLVNSGAIPGYRLGRRVLARRADVVAYIERHKVAPTAPALGTQDEDEALLAGIGGRAA